MINVGHVIDVAEIGGDDEGGGDVGLEVKAPSPLAASYQAGNGSKEQGGNWASVGHLFGFGSTEEKYRVMTLGCAERGRQSEGPFNHWTGKGWVKAQKGHYHDGIVNKKAKIVPMIVEATGGVAPHSRSQVKRYTGRAKGAGAIDRTKYGETRASTKSYYVHHMQRISKAAVYFDARAIRKRVVAAKQKASAAYAAPTADESEA